MNFCLGKIRDLDVTVGRVKIGEPVTYSITIKYPQNESPTRPSIELGSYEEQAGRIKDLYDSITIPEIKRRDAKRLEALSYARSLLPSAA